MDREPVGNRRERIVPQSGLNRAKLQTGQNEARAGLDARQRELQRTQARAERHRVEWDVTASSREQPGRSIPVSGDLHTLRFRAESVQPKANGTGYRNRLRLESN